MSDDKKADPEPIKVSPVHHDRVKSTLSKEPPKVVPPKRKKGS